MLESLFPLADPEWEKPLVAVIFLGANDAALPSRQQHGARVYIWYIHMKGVLCSAGALRPPLPSPTHIRTHIH